MSTAAAARIVLQESIHADGERLLRDSGVDVVVLDGPGDARMAAALRDADALIVRSTRVDAALLDLAPRLRVVGRHGAGLDNIDLEASRDRGIVVVNTPHSNTESVAEYVVAAAFSLFRRFDEGRESLAGGALQQPSSLPGQVQRAGLLGRELQGSTLGLVGAGAIGRAVARRVQALGVAVIAYDPFADAAVLADAQITALESLDDVISRSDILSLHLPGGDATRGIIDARRISLLPDGAVLINAARGGLVDHDALIAAVRSGSLMGAAVDVYEQEPPAADDAILHEPRIIATPHLAAMTDEAVQRMAVDVARSVLDAL
ncbi:D-3-phosphoglycerate dehydrogenase [Agrococcus baldri]|uniref:D-3-phosphoglycerate dehydrogenase n=1 Tax=Agrococcus baldri TaxID=153730 RepID=A0AA94HKD7_9MICO|nr:D-3-phosphoglycerate dehydrogenase [Agrococcus baldri]